MKKVLVTGGAGFIGSYVVDLLIEKGYTVTILDNLEPQVHKATPDYLNTKAHFIKGDVLSDADIQKALESASGVIHLAAMVGVGQSMYQVERYMKVNSLGTAKLLDHIITKKDMIKKIVVASSMSTYGEGSYRCNDCGKVMPPLRTESQMAAGDGELHCPTCHKQATPIPTSESKKQDCTSVYAISKKDQEDLVLTIGMAYKIPSVALRFFNVYGPRQSLNNPYTGVAAIFMSRLKNDHAPVIFEDGEQSRDFINVKDVARAIVLAYEKDGGNGLALNVGSGERITIKQVAEILAATLSKKISPEITGTFRNGDVRHCFADVSLIKEKLGFCANITFREGMKELAAWSEHQEATDSFEKAQLELSKRKLI